jgi:TATA-box binding protein (TBP) (component of TFIID and TFIIIB)
MHINVQPTKLRVSTVTACASVSTHVDLSLFFQNVPLIDVSNDHGNGVVYVTFCPPVSSVGDTRIEQTRGRLPMQKTHPNKLRRTRLVFDNQVTIIFRTDTATYVNVKLFKNGRVQLTGAKSPEQGQHAVECLVETLRQLASIAPSVVNDANAMCLASYQVCLINSDFKIGSELRRNRLHALLKDAGIRTTFEPCIYPGVKVDFFWSRQQRADGAGKCSCTVACSGRGRGDGNGDCRRVTIAVFESGCIIITGAHTMQQLDAAYDFIVNFIDHHFTEVAFKKV